MKKALALLVITALSVLAQIPKPSGSGGSGGGGGSGTVSGTTGAVACFDGITSVGDCTAGTGIAISGGEIAVDTAVVPFTATSNGTPTMTGQLTGSFAINISASPKLLYVCGADDGTDCTDVVLVGAVGSGDGEPPYTATVTAQTTLTVTAATHEKGSDPIVLCFDNSDPRVAVSCDYTKASNGDITFTWSPAFTGQVAIYSGAGGGGTASITTRAVTGTTDTTLNTDCGKAVTYSNNSAIAVTLPQAGASSEFASGCAIWHKNIGAGDVTITPSTSTISGAASIVLSTGESAVVLSNGTHYEALQNRLTAADGITLTKSRTGVAVGADTTYLSTLYARLAASNTFGAGFKQIFTSSSSTAGARLVCAALPDTPATGDIACDSGDSNAMKAYNGSAWVELGGGGSESSANFVGIFPQHPFSSWTTYTVASANQVQVIRLNVTTQFDVTDFGVNVAADHPAEVCSVGIYSEDGNTKLADTGTFSMAAAGAYTDTITPVALARGQYWLAATCSGTNAGFTALTSSNTTMLNQGGVFRGTAANAATAGALPATLGTVSAATGAFPAVNLSN